MKKKFVIFIIIIACTANMFACSGNEYERRTDASNTLYVGYVTSSFPTSFMPWLSREGIAPTIASTLYNTLFSYDEESGNYMPLIAQSWCYVDEDGQPIKKENGSIDYDRLVELYADKNYLSVKVQLHDNVTWSDGIPLTVEDVYYSFDIAANNALSNHAGALAWSSDLQHKYTNGVKTKQGIFTYHHGAADYGYHISEEEKDTVIYLHVNKVLGAVATLFSTILILPHHIWQPIVTVSNQLNSKDPTAETLYQYHNPVGSGAYVLDTANSNAQVIVLKRRENYHLKDEDGSTLYKVDTIKFVLYQELNVAIYALQKGHIDILDASISSNYMSLFQANEDIYVSNAEGIFTQTLVLNVNPVASEKNDIRNLLSMKDFRKAIALAVDQKELIKNVLNGAGREISAGLMKESFTNLYNEDADVLKGEQTQRTADANAILDALYPEKDKSGYRLLHGKRISFQILGTPGEQEVISFLQIQLQKIGVEVKFSAKGSSPESTYLYNSKFDMTLQGVSFTISNLDIMYKAHFVTLGSSSNYGRLVNAELASGIEEMRTTLNLDTKYSLIKQLQPLIANEYYKIPLYSSAVLSVARTDRYTGYVTVAGSTVFNSDTLQNLVRVS